MPVDTNTSAFLILLHCASATPAGECERGVPFVDGRCWLASWHREQQNQQDPPTSQNDFSHESALRLGSAGKCLLVARTCLLLKNRRSALRGRRDVNLTPSSLSAGLLGALIQMHHALMRAGLFRTNNADALCRCRRERQAGRSSSGKGNCR